MDEEYDNSELPSEVRRMVEVLEPCVHLFQVREDGDDWIRFIDISQGSVIGINQVTEEVALKLVGEEYHGLSDKTVDKILLVHQAKSQELSQVELPESLKRPTKVNFKL